MGNILSYVSVPFGYLMKWFYDVVGNYGFAILLFTLATKIIFMPISVWIQKNSIAMVKIQPEVNFLKARFAGNKDAIVDGQAELYKREHYHPTLSVIPLILQLLLIVVVVEIIYHPLTYIFNFSSGDVSGVAEYLNSIGVSINTSSFSYEIDIVKAVMDGKIDFSLSAETIGISAEALTSLAEDVTDFKINFLFANMLTLPSGEWGWYLLAPLLTTLSSAVMTLIQNKEDVLQREQSKVSQIGILVVTLGVSVYFGIGLPTGIAVYWVASNLFAIAQMYLLNLIMDPKKYVDYEALEASRKELDAANNFGKIDKNDPRYFELKKREREDYKKFKNISNKHLVFYSEKSGFYKYYEGIISELISRSNVVVHYVTNDPDDIIFTVAKEKPQIKPYYISLKKMTTLMMMVETSMFVMTTPDLDKYYLKRSFVKKDTEYVYIPHDMMSVHMSFNEGAFDAFDTIMCTGNHVKEEMRAIEKVYKLPAKNLVEFGYPLSDALVKAGELAEKDRNSELKEILIAPSWQEDNILDSCIDKLIEKLYCKEYKIIVRPHPEYVKRYKGQMDALIEKYKDYDEKYLTFELDFAKNKSIYSSDLIITDWSGIAPEFCFATKRPAVFINTKMKCPNPNYQKIGLVPVEISLRDKLGVSLEKEELDNVKVVVDDLIVNADKYKKTITEIFNNHLFNRGNASVKGAQYILSSLMKKSAKENK